MESYFRNLNKSLKKNLYCYLPIKQIKIRFDFNPLQFFNYFYRLLKLRFSYSFFPRLIFV